MNIFFYALFNFIVYSFLGWVLENTYSIYAKNSLQEDYFLMGPLKPMYGIAMAILILYNEILKFPFPILAVLCFIIPSTVEYISGHIMKKIFNKVYWDYSDLKYNLFGYVYLRTSAIWFSLSLVAIYYMQPTVRGFYESNAWYWDVVTFVIMIFFAMDFTVTVKGLLKGQSVKENS